MTPKSTHVEDGSAMVSDPIPEEDHMETVDLGFSHPDDHHVCNVTNTHPSALSY
jgi:hypothetical protein